MLKPDFTALKISKNLLAFSAGVDSSALFFLLIEHQIKFDIVIVDYSLRKESKKEVKHAKTLARKYKLFCHTIQAPTFSTNFEKKARDFRYEFFDALVATEAYDNVITAHQLNDQLEWLLMRLTKGAGLSELLGLQKITKKTHYTLIRPLLSYPKEKLLNYLKENNYPYFIDKSNEDEKYERNKFRKEFSDKLMQEYHEGIARSFDYLRQDKESIEAQFNTIYHHEKLHIIKLLNSSSKVKASDLILKKLGYLLSASQRKEIADKNALVIGGLWAIEIQEDLLYICPYITKPMPKEFKEKCRKYKIPQKIRSYCFNEEIVLEEIPISRGD
jgi:tRNA(Ile)-lysidine synthase